MKFSYFFLPLGMFLLSCATQVPYTNQVRDEFNLDTEEKLGKVQFFISHTIVMDEEVKNENSTTTNNGTLINSSNTKKESVIIQAGTPCVFDSYGPKGELNVRFETGEGRTLSFYADAKSVSARRYVFNVDWNQQGGPKIKYGGVTYRIDLLRGTPRNAYLKVARRKLEKVKRKDRFVRGLKV
ncbi:MAG TPA: hypothetical protein DEF82_09185 [Crocinitomicaceae bacterium]|nr:hypothetical protein [Crocinitomicaceae bacterium]